MATVYYNSSASGSNDGTSEANAYTDLQTALNSLSAGDHLYVKRAASREGVKTTNLTFSTSAGAGGDPTIIEGYATTPGDGGMYQTASPVYITGEHVLLMYFDVDKDNDSTEAIRLNADCCCAYRCKATSTYDFGNCFGLNDAIAVECSAYGRASSVGDGAFEMNRGMLINCYAEVTSGNAGAAINLQSGYRTNSVIGCVCVNSGSGTSNNGIRVDGSNNSGGGALANNTFYNFNNGILEEDGTRNTHTSPFVYYGNLIYSCGNGINNAQGTNSGTLTLYSFDNAFGAITSNAVSNLSCNVNSKTLTASPFLDTTDFKINATSGGGALIKGLLGIPDEKDQASTTRVDFSTHGGVAPDPNVAFSVTDSGTLSLSSSSPGDKVTVSGRTYQKISDGPIVWRRA